MASGVSGLKESFDDSGLGFDLYEQAGLSDVQVKGIKAAQQAYQQALEDFFSVEGKKGAGLKRTVSSSRNSMDVLPRDLEGTELHPPLPALFEADHVTSPRSSYIQYSFPSAASIRVKDMEGVSGLYSASHKFRQQIADPKNTEEENDQLLRVILYATTQIFPNYLCGDARAEQVMKRGEIEEKGADFVVAMDQVDLRFEPVKNFFGMIQKNAFKITLQTTVETRHQDAIEKPQAEAGEEEKQRIEIQNIARKALGITPVLTDKLTASVMCTRQASGEYKFENIRVESSLQMS